MLQEFQELRKNKINIKTMSKIIQYSKVNHRSEESEIGQGLIIV